MKSKFRPEIVSDYLKGIKMIDISKKWGISQIRIRYHLKKLGIPPRIKRPSENKILQFLEEYKSGKKKIKEIEEKFHVSSSTIWKYAKKYNVQRTKEETIEILRKWAKLRWKDPNERKRISKLLKGRKFSEETLTKMRYVKGRYKIPEKMTKELAYIIGVCLGDASVLKATYFNKNGYKYEKYVLSLTVKDKDFLLKFKNYLEKVFCLSNLKISRVFVKKFKKYYYNVRVQKKEVVEFVLNKVTNLNWIENLPKEYKKEILRGMFDSDGSVSIDKHKGKPVLVIRFGNYKYPETFEKLINFFELKYRKYKKEKIILFHFVGEKALHFYNLLGEFTIKRKDKIVKDYLKLRGGGKNEFMGN